jgi:hypothetical protein
MRVLKKIISSPLPFHYSRKNLMRFSIIIFVLIILFQFLFEPFNVEREEHTMSYIYICIIQSLIATSTIVFYIGIAGIVINKPNWNVAKEIILITSLLIIIGVLLFLARDLFYDNPKNWSLKYLFEEIRNSFFVGLLILLIYYPLRHLNSQKNIPGDNDNNDNTQIWINSTVKSESFLLNPDSFIYAKSDGNYIEIYLLTDSKTTKIIKRITIKNFALQLSNLDYIMRVHRSYMVNLNHPHIVQRGLNGINIIFDNLQEKIPVSRSMAKEFGKRSQ